MANRCALLILAFLLLAVQAQALDFGLQQAASNALGSRRGAVVVLSLPDRKPLALVGGAQIHRAEPPGSLFKLVTAYAALSRRITEPTASIDCRNSYRAGSQCLRCIKPGGHGKLNLREAIAQSCNLHFYTLANRLGADSLQRYARELGWLEKPLPNPPTNPGETAKLGVGELPGLEISPLKAAQFVASLALDSNRALDRKALRTLRDGMILAVKNGTASAAAIPGVAVAGKTGTPTDRTDPHATNAWFVGYAPVEHPRVAIAVFVARGHGFNTAAPLAGKVLRAYFQKTPGQRSLRPNSLSARGSFIRRGEPVVRVGLFRLIRPTWLSFRCLAPVTVINGSSSSASPLSLPSGTSGRIRIQGSGVELQARGKSWRMGSARLCGDCALGSSGIAPRPYGGTLVVRARSGILVPVNEIPLEDYVSSVLPGEMPPDWPREALACQAVIARTFALAGGRRHASEGFDLCDLTHCQVYRGRMDETASARAAAVMTRGIVLQKQGRVLDALYHSTCGGQTASPSEIWPSRPFAVGLKSISDVEAGRCFCRESPHFRWRTQLTRKQLAEALGMGSQVRSLTVLKRGASGRALLIRVQGDRSQVFGAEQFWTAVSRKLGWGKIKSTWFDVKPTPGGFNFEGRGLGHGVGLCQWGARGMAESGYSFKQILRHYYPGVEL